MALYLKKLPGRKKPGPINVFFGASLDLHVTTLTLSLILTLTARLTQTLQPYPNPNNPTNPEP